MKSDNKRQIDTAIITAGGYGTRFFPFTNVVQKELLPLGNKPIIQLLVEECIDNGIKKIFIITRPASTLIRQHFKIDPEYERYLKTIEKTILLGELQIPQNVCLEFIEENDSIPYGNAQGLLTIKNKLKNYNSFLVLFGDDIVLGGNSSVQEIINDYEMSDCDAAIGVQEMKKELIPNYGNVEFSSIEKNRIIKIIQKPSPKEIVSTWVVFSQMVVSPRIFSYITANWRDHEPDLGIALNTMARDGKVIATKVSGHWVSVGTPREYVLAGLDYSLRNKQITEKDIEDVLERVKR